MPFLIFFGIIALSVVRIGPRRTLSGLYVILSWLTFPGVVLHEASLRLLCAAAGIPVHGVRYFAFKNPPGYVMHDKAGRYRDAYLLAIGPCIVNTAFAMGIFAFHCFGTTGIADFLSLWLGASFALHALPGAADSQSLWRWSKRIWARSPPVFIGLPLVIVAAFTGRLTRLANIIYVFALYSVTFCLIATVVIAGSIALPGAYTAKVVSTNPGWADNTPDQGAVLDNHGQHFGSYVPVFVKIPYFISSLKDNGRAASAMDWLPIAETAMEGNDSKAILIKVSGSGRDADTVLPVNGKCHRWLYQYAVPAEKIVYNVSVRDGTLESVDRGALTNDWWTSRINKNASPEIVNWTMDSAAAATAANKKAEMPEDGITIGSADYVLEENFDTFYKGELIWNVSYDSPNGIAIIVDQDSGYARWAF